MLAPTLPLAGAAWAGDEAESLIASVRAEGCAVTPATRAAVLGRAGLQGDALDGLLAALVRAVLAEDGSSEVTVLTPTACAGLTPPADFALVVVVAREAGCVLSREDAALAPLGGGSAAVDGVVAELREAGEGWTEGDALRLGRGLCRGLLGAPAMTTRREAEAAGCVEARLRAEPGCRLSRGSLAAEGAAVGIGPADIGRAVASLQARERLEEAGDVPRRRRLPVTGDASPVDLWRSLARRSGSGHRPSGGGNRGRARHVGAPCQLRGS